MKTLFQVYDIKGVFVMNNAPIVFNPSEPLAHYDQSGKRYKKVKKRLTFGIVTTIPAFFLGAACTIYNPWLMAVFAFFSLPFTLLSIIGCVTRRTKICLATVPIGVILAVLSAVSNSFFAPFGAAAYLIAAYAEFMAVSASNEFYELKELPGFPFFDPSMDDISFAAKDHFGADEFIDESSLYTEKKTYRFDPSELEPSNEMEEIVTGIFLLKEGDTPPQTEEIHTKESNTENEIPKELAPEMYTESAYEQMISVMPEKREDISDVDLFG